MEEHVGNFKIGIEKVKSSKKVIQVRALFLGANSKNGTNTDK